MGNTAGKSGALSGETAFADTGKNKQMKGIGFVNVRHYVEQKQPPDTWSAVLESLSEQDRADVGAAIAVGWYDVLLFARLLRAVDRVCGKGDLKLLPEIGRYEADQDLNRVLRVFLRVLTPLQIFRVEGRLWSHFQNAGTWKSTRTQTGVDAILTGWATDEALCTELAGYLVRLVQFTGGEDVRVLHPQCRTQGHASCLFQYTWRQ